MPLRQQIHETTDPCDLSRRWLIHPKLAVKLVALARALEFPIAIFSGYRTEAHQRELLNDNKYGAAQVKLSTHTMCPAIGADVEPLIAATSAVKARFGAEAVSVGLRWGGGSKVDPETGIPRDWKHVDLGPRVVWERKHGTTPVTS